MNYCGLAVKNKATETLGIIVSHNYATNKTYDLIEGTVRYLGGKEERLRFKDLDMFVPDVESEDFRNKARNAKEFQDVHVG